MLTSTFLHIPKIGPRTEQNLWAGGILTWQDFLQGGGRLPLKPAKREHIQGYLLQSEKALRKRDYRFFSQLLPPREHWRAYSHFSDKIAYLDIETTGLCGHDDITVIGLYDGISPRCFLQGKDLEKFPQAIKKYDLIVTFFGTCFDLPFLQRQFPGLEFPQLHIDLCFLSRRLGYRGGLKHIEMKFGIERSEEVMGIDGAQAVYLWRQYQRGSQEALDLLIQYNQEDIVNLKVLLEILYPSVKEKTFLGLPTSR
jgi:uncharacterized protein